MGLHLTPNQIEVLFYVARHGWSRARCPLEHASMVGLVGQGLLCSDGHYAHITPRGEAALHRVRNGLRPEEALLFG